MQFNLKKNIVFFDIEATGLHVLNDRIIQIALIKYLPGQDYPEEMETLVNPGIPISPDSFAVHGISVDDVRNKPVFSQVAKDIYDFIGDADLSGYNLNRFDVPMLMEEFSRAGIDFDIDKRKIIDVQSIFYKMEPRTLGAAHKFYCGKKMENAHDALADVRATVDVLKGQIARYKDVDYETKDGEVITNAIENDMDVLYAFTHNKSMVDVTNRLKYDPNGVVVFNFGKYMGQAVGPILFKDRQYYNWILNKEFSVQVKQAVKNILVDYEKSQS